MLAVTGASGQLGRLVIDALSKSTRASDIVAVVRAPSKAEDMEAAGLVVRRGDYDAPETLVSAFAGVEKLLLISSSEVGGRVAQHEAAIDAAKSAGVRLIAYTSILHADTSPLLMAADHVVTEAYLRSSGVPNVVLRNSWYNENYLEPFRMALRFGSFAGAAGDGRIAAAARRDYAEAAAAVLLSPESQAGKIYELAGDTAFTMGELAAETARLTGRPIVYDDLSKEAYVGLLIRAGMPELHAELIADADVGASRGGLFDDGHCLSALIGRPTTPISRMLADAIENRDGAD